MVNRGFVPTELRDPATRPGSQPTGSDGDRARRAPQERNTVHARGRAGRKNWFTRDPEAIAAARKGLDHVAPFYVEADGTPNPGGWPKGGQTDLTLPNNHLQYAFTWFGIAADPGRRLRRFRLARLQGTAELAAETVRRSRTRG